MQSEGTFLLMAIAALVSAVALLMNAIASIGAFRAIRRLERKVEPLIPEAMSALQEARAAIQDVTADVRGVTGQMREMITELQDQVKEIGVARDEFTTRFKVQAERAELILDDTITRVQDVAHFLQSSVMRPVREVNGVVSGIRAALQTFVRGRRPSVAQATSDEEMFI